MCLQLVLIPDEEMSLLLTIVSFLTSTAAVAVQIDNRKQRRLCYNTPNSVFGSGVDSMKDSIVGGHFL